MQRWIRMLELLNEIEVVFMYANTMVHKQKNNEHAHMNA